MRIVKGLAVLVGCPIIGAAVGFIIGGLLLPHDPTGRGASGDGFLIVFCMGVGLVISTVVVLVVAVRFGSFGATEGRNLKLTHSKMSHYHFVRHDRKLKHFYSNSSSRSECDHSMC